VALSEVFWQLLLIRHASPKPRPVEILLLLLLLLLLGLWTVEAVPGAADPPAWPGSCVKFAASADGLTPDERTTSSKAVAAVAAAAVAAVSAAAFASA
jgi:hypothetical protein